MTLEMIRLSVQLNAVFVSHCVMTEW